MKDLFEQPVFICGAPRSGTTLLTNLLDGHPQLMVYPHEVHFLEHFRRRETYAPDFFKKNFLKLVPQNLFCDAVSLSRHNHYMFHVYGPVSELKFGNHDFKLFKEVYTQELNQPQDLKSVMQAFAKAFYKANKPFWPDYDPEYFVDKRPLDYEISAPELKRLFPKAKFIHVIRHPAGMMASLKNRRIRSVIPLRLAKMFGLSRWRHIRWKSDMDMVSFLSGMSYTSMVLSKRNQQAMGEEHYHILKYEDLIGNQCEELEKIRSFLNIQKSPWMGKQTQWRLPKAPRHPFINRKLCFYLRKMLWRGRGRTLKMFHFLTSVFWPAFIFQKSLQNSPMKWKKLPGHSR